MPASPNSAVLLDASLEDYRKTMAINVDGVVYGCRTAIPHLLKSGGSIINVSSASGLGGDWAFAFYNASKGAVTNLTPLAGRSSSAARESGSTRSIRASPNRR